MVPCSVQARRPISHPPGHTPRDAQASRRPYAALWRGLAFSGVSTQRVRYPGVLSGFGRLWPAASAMPTGGFILSAAPTFLQGQRDKLALRATLHGADRASATQEIGEETS
jgi:hypothetical protein